MPRWGVQVAPAVASEDDVPPPEGGDGGAPCLPGSMRPHRPSTPPPPLRLPRTGWGSPSSAQSLLLADQAEMPAKVRISMACHQRYSLWYARWATAFTVFPISINAVIAIGTAISFDAPLRLAVASLSIFSGVGTIVHSTLRWDAKSEQHAAAAKRFEMLYARFSMDFRGMDVQHVSGGAQPTEWQKWCKDCLDAIEQAPMISDDMYEKVRDAMDVHV